MFGFYFLMTDLLFYVFLAATGDLLFLVSSGKLPPDNDEDKCNKEAASDNITNSNVTAVNSTGNPE